MRPLQRSVGANGAAIFEDVMGRGAGEWSLLSAQSESVEITRSEAPRAQAALFFRRWKNER